jgi:hypothetical protein
MRIKSRRSFLGFYATILMVVLLNVCIGSIFFGTYFNLLANKGFEIENLLLPIFGIGLYFMAFYFVVKIFQLSPKITLNKEKITFGKSESYLLNDIKRIVLTGKKPSHFIGISSMEGAMLQFKDRKKKYIYDCMYANTWQIKALLEAVVVKKIPFNEADFQKIGAEDVQFQVTEEFKGNPYLSLPGISLWAFFGFIIYLLLLDSNPATAFFIFIGIFGSLWFFGNSWCMFFFCISQDFLTVRNHCLFWIKHYYKLENIRELVIDQQGDTYVFLRVITTDFRNRAYLAGTLKDATWLALIDNLEKKGIKVRNECIGK